MLSRDEKARRLRGIAQHIRVSPENYDQASWCGTAQCVKGWAVSLYGTDEEIRRSNDLTRGCALSNGEHTGIGAHLLGLSGDEAQSLFDSGWMEPWVGDDFATPTAEEAAARLEVMAVEALTMSPDAPTVRQDTPEHIEG